MGIPQTCDRCGEPSGNVSWVDLAESDDPNAQYLWCETCVEEHATDCFGYVEDTGSDPTCGLCREAAESAA